MYRKIDRQEIDDMDQRFRAQLINSLSGFKSINLIGTANQNGQTNLAIISSVIHLGANPPLMGFIQRPITARRDTYNNLIENQYFTLNHLNTNIFKQGHQSSARYDENTSEFEAVGLTPQYTDNFPAPYVAESHLKIGLQFKEAIPIPLNGTLLMIGEIQEFFFPEDCLSEDGYLDIERAGSITTSGLDAYHSTTKLERLSYAKTDRPLSSIPFNTNS